jgi:hypothetical protein
MILCRRRLLCVWRIRAPHFFEVREPPNKPMLPTAK